MSVAVTVMLVVEGMFISPAPPGQPVTSRADCVSLCYKKPLCRSVFYDTAQKQCYPVKAVYTQNHMNVNSTHMQYLAPQPTGCSEGYIFEKALGLCYKLVKTTATWQAAGEECTRTGGHLIKIDTKTLDDFIGLLIRKNSLIFAWIGGQSNDGITWTWMDNSVFTFSAWFDNFPVGIADKKKCVHMVNLESHGIIHHGWGNVQCNEVRAFICPTPPLVSSTC